MRFVSLIVALLTLSLLSGCAAKEETSGKESSQSRNGAVEKDTVPDNTGQGGAVLAADTHEVVLDVEGMS